MTIAGTEGSRILPGLDLRPEDDVVVKKRYSAFFGTNLDSRLNRWGTQRLIIAGVNTHACIRVTAIDAYQRDLDVILAAECIASYDQEHHDVSLRYMAGKIARVMTNSQIDRVVREAVERNRA